MIVVNFFGGPGSGKSTSAAHVFALLKWEGVNCELSTEYAKDKVWEDSLAVLHDQPYILGKQHHKLFRLIDKVDVVLTDSPLLLSTIYGEKWGDGFERYAVELFDRYQNINFFMTRLKNYNPKGRIQNYDEALELDTLIKEKLDKYKYKYDVVPGVPDSATLIRDRILELI
jgi:nicotinamide riboside kinase